VILFWAAHPKIKGFISHGGLLGTQETIFHGVPTVVIPLFAEQDYNAMRTAERGTGVHLELGSLCGLLMDQYGCIFTKLLFINEIPYSLQNSTRIHILFVTNLDQIVLQNITKMRHGVEKLSLSVNERNRFFLPKRSSASSC